MLWQPKTSPDSADRPRVGEGQNHLQLRTIGADPHFHLVSFLASWKTPLNILYTADLQLINSFSFCISKGEKKLYFAFIFERDFSPGGNLRLTVLFSQHLKDVTPLSSHLHCFRQEIYGHPYLCSCVQCLFFSLAALKIFPLSLVLNKLIMMCLGIVFFMFLVLRAHLYWYES